MRKFLESLDVHFNAEIFPVNFNDSAAAADFINSWVKDMTKDKIKDLIERGSINDLTRLILVNAIYFKGAWESPFNAKQTKKEQFFVSNNKIVMVDMMEKVKQFDFAELDIFHSKMAELPYKGDKIAIQIVLPNEKNGLAALETKMSEEDVSKMFKQKKRSTKLWVKMPKFKISMEAELSEILKNM